jgi:hypothetical protein
VQLDAFVHVRGGSSRDEERFELAPYSNMVDYHEIHR